MQGSSRDRLGVVIGAAVLAIVHVVRAWPTFASVVDDAYISARYSMNVALGHGLLYNAGQPPIEGYTNLLWVLQNAAIWKATGADLHDIAVDAGLVYGVLGIFAITALGVALARRWTPIALLPALWLAVDAHYAVVATNGIESSQFIFAVVAALAAVLWSEDGGWTRILGAVLCGLVVAVRPEGIAVAAAIAGYDVIRRRGALGRPATWAVVVGAVAGAVPVWVGRLLYFGQALPNTWYAKDHRSITEQIVFDLGYLGQDWPYWAVVAVLFAIGALVPRWSARRVITAALVLGLVVVEFRVDLWMPGGRLLLPAVALALALFAERVDALVGADGPLGSRTAARWAIGLVVAILPAIPLVIGPIPAHVFGYDGHHTALPGNGSQRAAEFLRAHAPSGASLATRDAGVFAFYIGPDVTVDEIHDRALTRPHPGGAASDVRSYTPVNPDFFVATVQREDQGPSKYGNDNLVFRRMTAKYVYLGRVVQHYHRYYDVYARADLGVPPLPADLVVNRDGPPAP